MCAGEANQLPEKLTLTYWNEQVVEAGTTIKGQVRIIKRQIGLLVDFFGLKRKRDLITFSMQGQKLADTTIISQYKSMLRRIATGRLKVGRPMSIMDTLLTRYPHVFRGGTLTSMGRDAHDRIRREMTTFIQDCQEDADRLAAKLSSQETPVDLDPNDPEKLLGKSVLVSGAHWGETGRWYTGIVQAYAPKRRGLKRKFYQCL